MPAKVSPGVWPAIVRAIAGQRPGLLRGPGNSPRKYFIISKFENFGGDIADIAEGEFPILYFVYNKRGASA